MKTHLSLIFFIVLFSSSVHAQQGNTRSYPIEVGTYNSEFDYSDSQNTEDFTNNYTGRPSNDVFYKFTINTRMKVIMKHCESELSDTYLSLLDASGKLIDYNDDADFSMGCGGGAGEAYLSKILDAGTYYVVAEGYEENGVITTQITGMFLSSEGDSRQNAIDAGTYSKSFDYSDIQNMNLFSNQYAAGEQEDVFYKFTLTRKMIVTITHCGSMVYETCAYLLNAAGGVIASNDYYSDDGGCSSSSHAFIQRTLEPGTYYIVSEGYDTAELITTNITGYASEDFDYPDIPNTYSAEPEAVGSLGGTFDVSATGAATYSIPIKIPQGVGGMQPTLAIVYNSQAGNGMLGWGCNLSGMSVITRGPKDMYHDGTAKALTFSADEAYYLDGKRLIYSSGTIGQEGAVYYLESDPFTKVIVHGTYTTSTANTWFEVQSSTGQICYYGNTTGARQSYTAGNFPRIYAWYLDYVEDPLGNYMNYTYNKWSYCMYPNTIMYGNNKNGSTGLQNTVTFSYETRSNDPQLFVIEGVKGTMDRRLKTITSKTGNSVYRVYDLQYNTTGDASGTKYSRLTSVTERNGAGDVMQPVKLNWSYLPSLYSIPVSPQVNAASVYPAVAFSEQQFIAGDFNGDGLTDMMGISPVKIPTGTNSWTYDTYAYIYWASLDSSGNVRFVDGTNYRLGASFQLSDMQEYKAGSSVIDFDGDGLNEFVVPHVSINDHWKQIAFYVYGNTVQGAFGYNLQYSSEMPAYATGDLNNDGKGDIVFIEKGHSGNRYPGEIIGHNSGTSLYRTAFNLTLPSSPDKVFVSDLNGNGLEDMMVIYSGGYTIFWNQGNGITGTTFSDAKKTTGTNVSKVWMIRSGDFNGDGLMDILMNSTGESSWYFALNNGNGTFTKSQACTLGLYDQSFTSKDDSRFDCLIYDFDLDGKSDVVITKAMYDKKSAIFQGSWGEFNKTYTYWMHSTGSALTIVRSATSNRDEDALSSRYLVGDFNGDGQVELMNYGYNCYNSSDANRDPVWRLYPNSSYNTDKGKVTSVTGDYGSVTNITYTSLVNGGIYTKGTGSSYPIADYTLPLHVVKKVNSDNGAAGRTMTTNYRYSGLKMHLQGKGLLGMSSMIAENTTLGTVSESGVKAWNTSFYIPSATYTKNTIDGSTAETNTTLTIVDKGSRKYFAYPSSTTEKDLDGNMITTTRQFNTTYGYMTHEKADYGNNMYRTVQYGNYTLAGKTYQPQLITKVQKHTDDSSTFTQKMEITYDTSKGYKTKTVENYGSSLPLTTEFTYDTWGNVKTEKISGSGVSALTSNYDYDTTKRFIAKTSTNPLSSIIAYTYDTWGNVLTETDESDTSNKLTTRHTFDGWGNRLSTLFPDGTKRSYLSGWNVNSSKRFFTLAQATGEPWIKTWYDNQGREVLVETIGPQSMSIKEATTYNNKGLITQKKTETGNLTTTENYTYDARGRVLTQTSSAGRSVSYAYGNRTVSSTTNGKTYTQVYDPWGGVKSVTDPVSSIAYTYKSLGKPQKIVTGGATFTMTYYDTGKQKTLTDPNAGTITYTYDAAGRLKTQVDGKSKTTTNTYDVLGRMSSSATDGVTTTYTYGTSGNNLLRLTKEQTGNNYTTYTYDNYGRTRTETRQIEGTGALAFTYSYNSQGQLSNIAYPGSLTVSRNYDAYGNLRQVLAGTQNIWELTGATGTVTTTKLGGTLISTETRNSQGLLSNLKTMKGTTSLHNMNYVFDGATGNLTSRTGMIGQTETFTYDSADRLTVVKQGSSTVMNMGYHANGNIVSKTGLGSYSYDKPHAVSTVDNTGGLISENNQTIAYTAFDKVSSISETVGSNNYLLNITYGPDRQRWKSTLKTNNAVARTTVYAGDYEMVTEGGVTKQLYYLGGNNGLVAVYVKQSGQPDKIYYAHKDHLGSVVKLTDNVGTEVFKASYDVWGRRTVANNTFKFHRGYTGHEHLDEFKLIDMNGRMYDPLLARFLSPDPFVQMPDFSQNFNRYTYCLNNPLIYTDPSGEFWHLIIGAAIGGAINWVANGADLSWEGLSYFATGAVSGALTAAFPGAAIGITAGAGAANSAIGQGFNNGWNNINLQQVTFDGIMAGTMAYVGGEIASKFAGPVQKLTEKISSPMLRELIVHEASGLPFGTVMGGIMAVADDDPNTSFLDGMWSGAKKSFVTSGLSAVGSAANYSLDNKVGMLTGIPKGGEVRVGRWMSENEYNIMKKTGRMVEGPEGLTFVATGGSDAFQGAKVGSVYVEFKVPKNSLIQGGKPNWYKTVGPSAKGSQIRALNKQGGQMLPKVRSLSPILKIK